MNGAERRRRLEAASVYLIVTLDAAAPDELVPLEAALASGAVDLVQLRDVSGEEPLLRERAARMRALCRAHDALLILNDRPELAAALDLDGAHVGREDVPPETARAWLGGERLLGLSTHDPEEVAAAQAVPVDHIGLGPCFPTTSKNLAYEPGGADLVARCLPAAGALPVFPIGGITPENVTHLASAGATRAAVGAGILGALDPANAARGVQKALRRE